MYTIQPNITGTVKSYEVFFYSLKTSLDAAAGDPGLHLIYRSSEAVAHTEPNISKNNIHGECMLIFLDTKNIITRKNVAQTFLIFDAITNENALQLIQLDTFGITIITQHPALAGSDNSDEYTFFGLYTFFRLYSVPLLPPLPACCTECCSSIPTARIPCRSWLLPRQAVSDEQLLVLV